MKSRQVFKFLASGVMMLVVAAFAFYFFEPWKLLQNDQASVSKESAVEEPATEEAKILELSEQARKNLKLVSKEAKLGNYWRTVLIPGEIVDRPGVSDRGVTSPAVGVVTKVYAFPGDTISAGQPLFMLQLFSEYLQNTQAQLFKASKETELLQEEVTRLQRLADSGAIAGSRMIELNNQLRRQQALIQAFNQDLLTRGLSPDHIAQISKGEFISTIDVVAPPLASEINSQTWQSGSDVSLNKNVQQRNGLAYEVQNLAAELGQQVQAGQLLGTLSNHESLFIEGHAFKKEAAYLEQAAKEGRPIVVEFAEESDGNWPEISQSFTIHHLSNSIDSVSRTFDFYLSLLNQSRTYEKDGETFLVWRFRPGQRARLYVPVEEYRDVYVVPAEAVINEGPESYVFQQNGDLFRRIPVHVLHVDRRYVVIANDGSLKQGFYLAQSAAASLNRVLKAQSASGEQPGLHVHPDGTVHAAH